MIETTWVSRLDLAVATRARSFVKNLPGHFLPGVNKP
jgi:hypothetical protein